MDNLTLAIAGALVFVIIVCSVTALIAAVLLVRRKVSKEIGLWKIHRRYHPKPAPRDLHF